MSVLLFVILNSLNSAAAETADFTAVTQSRIREISACFEVAQAQNGKLAGQIDLRWPVDENGEYGTPTIDPENTTLTEKGFQNCVLDKVKEWHFAPLKKMPNKKEQPPFVHRLFTFPL